MNKVYAATLGAMLLLLQPVVLLAKSADAVSRLGLHSSTEALSALDDTTPPVLYGVPEDVHTDCRSIPPPALVTATDDVDGPVPVTFEETAVVGGPYGGTTYSYVRTWTATDAAGNVASATQQIHLMNISPSVYLPFHVKTLQVNQALSITGQIAESWSPTPNGPLGYRWAWEWGDGSVDHTQEVFNGSNYIVEGSHSYSKAGDYLVYLFYWDDCGDQVLIHHLYITVVNDLADPVPPVLHGVPNDVTIYCQDLPLAHNVTATDDVDGPLAVSFTEKRTDYTANNYYTLTRTWSATDAAGNTTTATQVVSVLYTPPSVSNNISKTNHLKDQAFTVTVGFYDDNPTEAVWTWGDGTFSSGTINKSDYKISGTHTYRASGNYSVALRLTDACGMRYTQYYQLTVDADTDGDGILDSQDNCLATANANQADLDKDGVGDVCDSDIDGDGLDNQNDCSPHDASSGAKLLAYMDADGDGFGDMNKPAYWCQIPVGYVTNAADCNDADASINPAATEILYDGKDNNCSGGVDEGSIPFALAQVPAVGVGGGKYFEIIIPVQDGAPYQIAEAGFLSGNTSWISIDKVAIGNATSPNAIRVWGTPPSRGANDTYTPVVYAKTTLGQTDDKQLQLQVSNCKSTKTWYPDADGDGYGNSDSGIFIIACTQPLGYVSTGSDCNDADASIKPGKGKNNGCAGTTARTSTQPEQKNAEASGLNSLQPLNFYPNPVKDLLTIQTGAPAERFEVSLYTLQGTLVYKGSHHTDHVSGNLELNLIGYQQGIYLLRLKVNDQQQYVKIIKE